MIIHKSHSKNEICKLIQLLGISISNPKQYRKIELSALFLYQLSELDFIKPSLYLPFTNVIELKLYLTNPNPNKLLTIKKKGHVIHICKKIKHFCRNNYCVELTDYTDIHELYKDARYIQKYGGVPSVRKALKELNQYPQKTETIDPHIPDHIIKELEIKQKLKAQNKFQFKVSKGEFKVTFD